MKAVERLLRRSLLPNQLLKKNETVVVAVSGGADSLCLLYTLWDYNRRHHQSWGIIPVHIHPGFPNWKTERIERICLRLELNCVVKKISVLDKIQEAGSDFCFFCARERRKALFQTAAELGCKKVALGHHLEDVNETFLLNLLFSASARTILPSQPLFNGALTIIRPLYYFTNPMIKTRLKNAGISPVRNRCPYQSTSTRMVIRRFLDRLARKDERIKTNLFWGIHNIKSKYLPAQKNIPNPETSEG